MTDEVTHRCRSGKLECVSRTPDGAAVTMKPDTLCPGCITQIQVMLGDLPHLAAALKCFLGGSMATAYTSKVNSTPTPSAPMNVTVYDLIDDIGDAIDRAGGMGVRIDNLIREPGVEFQVWQRGEPAKRMLDGVDRAMNVRKVHRKAEGMVGLKKIWQRRVSPCPYCNLPTLGSWFGENTVHCTNEDCNGSLTRDEYDLWVISKSKSEKGK